MAGEGERVLLGGAMKARGGPEGWLTSVEALMRSALKAAARRAMKEYVVQPKMEWLRQQPAQLVLLVSSIFWCREVMWVCAIAASRFLSSCECCVNCSSSSCLHNRSN